MKKIVTVFARNRYVSGATGNSQNYQMPANLMNSLGGSVAIRWEVTIYSKSANAELGLTVYEGTKQDPRPSTNDFSGKTIPLSVSPAPPPWTGIGIMPYIDTTVSYSGLVDAVMNVKAATGSAQEQVDAEIRATLTYT